MSVHVCIYVCIYVLFETRIHATFFGFTITRKHVTFLSIFISFYNFVLSDIKFIENEKRINDRHLYPFSCLHGVFQIKIQGSFFSIDNILVQYFI